MSGVSHVPDVFIEWLANNSEVVDCIRIDSTEEAPSHQEVIKQLNNALLQEIERQAPVMKPPERRPKHFSGNAALAFNRRYFISLEIQRIRKLQLDLLSQRVADIVNMLMLDGMDAISLRVDHERFVKQTVYDSREIISLMSLSGSLSQVIEDYEKELKTHAGQRQLILEVIEAGSQIYEADISFLLTSPLQDQFEKLFEYEGFPLSVELEQLASKGYNRDFTMNIVRLVLSTRRYFALPNTADSVLCTMLFRYAYDKLYSYGLSPLLHTKITRNEIDSMSKYLKSAQFKTMDPPDQYCPQHKPDDIIADVFGQSEVFSGAILSLDRLEFQTNPFDALYWVQCAIHGIETAVAQSGECDDVMLPFDDTFALFLCVTAAATVPELPVYAEFVDTCLPAAGLNVYFDFASTKLRAAIAHLTVMARQDALSRPA